MTGHAFRIIALGGAALWGAGVSPAHASWLDSDFYCRVYGCVIVHDGRTFDVYDNYNFDTGETVPPGGRMIPWTGNPFQGAGEVNPVFTGTRTEGFHRVPLQEEGVLLGVDQTGSGEIDLGPDANQRGFLDASGVFTPVTLSGESMLVAQETSALRSFYLSSRTDFFVAAQARVLSSGSALDIRERLSDIALVYDVTLSGNDDGMAFGANARRGNFARQVGNVDDLGDIAGAPTNIMEFRNDIRRRASTSLPSQSVRFDYAYGFEQYDMSMGAGHLRYEIVFEFFNR